MTKTELYAALDRAREAKDRSYECHAYHEHNCLCWQSIGHSCDEAATIAADVERLVGEVTRLHSWEGLMSLLDEHYPADIFTATSQDSGPRIVALMREIDRLNSLEAKTDAAWDRDRRGYCAALVQRDAEIDRLKAEVHRLEQGVQWMDRGIQQVLDEARQAAGGGS